LNQHFIMDFETLGQDVFEIPMLDCAYVAFDWDRFTSDNPYSLEEIVGLARKDKLEMTHQVREHGAKYVQRDLDWWLSQSEEAKKTLKPSKSDVRVEVFIDNIINYMSGVGKINYWWSRANTFDPIILQRWAKIVGRKDEIEELLKFWTVRDTRTWIDAKLNFPKKNGFIPLADEEYWNKTFVHHDSRFDIAADILRLQTIARLENDMEQPAR
jgi:hypothetical protein